MKRIDVGWIFVLSVSFAILAIILLSLSIQYAWLASGHDCAAACRIHTAHLGSFMWDLCIASAVLASLAFALWVYLRIKRGSK